MAGTLEQHRRASFEVPAGATDCHIHVFGDVDRYPLASRRNYTPAPATLEMYIARSAQVGLQRVVLTQPSVYGEDNSAMLDAIAQHGQHRARGVAAVTDAASDEDIADLHQGGIRGARLFMNGTDADAIAASRATFERLQARLAGSGWHIELLTWLPVVSALYDTLADSRVPVVIDHIGRPRGGDGIAQPGFCQVVELAQHDHVWVKLSSPYRVSNDRATAIPFFRAFVQRDTHRLLWGTDWPHPVFVHGAHRVISDDPTPDIYSQQDFGALLDILPDAGADAAVVQRVLVANPQRLYGFADERTTVA